MPVPPADSEQPTAYPGRHRPLPAVDLATLEEGIPHGRHRAEPEEKRRFDRQSLMIGAGGVLLGLLLFAMMLIPVPYAVQTPGPTVDTLSEDVAIQIAGAEVFEDPSGELLLTTVSVRGGPRSTVTVGDAITGWLRGDTMVIPAEEAFPPNTGEAELDAYQQQLMTSSQENAAAAALQALDYEVPMELVIADVESGSAASGLVQTDDVFVGLTRDDTGERTDFLNFRTLSDLMQEIPPGTSVTAHLIRDGAETTATFETGPRTEFDTRPGSVLGIYIGADITFPLEVSFDLDNIGGPSAGMMFSLAIVDLLTEGDLTGGVIVAGTGTMSIDSYVGPIGGIQQKMAGAARDGAEWFLAPIENCPEVIGHVPSGMTVIPVVELQDAVEAVEAIAAGDVEGLPSCPAP